MITPNSDQLAEFNPCHVPAGSSGGGQFCPATMVGITSSPPSGVAPRSNRTIFGRDMKAFAAKLSRIPGVSDTTVKPGVGAWDGGGEPTWVVRYRGNGQARKLLAATGKQYKQQAVLVMHSCKGSSCSPMHDITFAGGVNTAQREEVGRALAARGFGGWTWHKDGGKTKLRVAFVSQWAGGKIDSPAAHTKQLTRVFRALRARSGRMRASRMDVQGITTEVMEQAGEFSYDRVLRGG